MRWPSVFVGLGVLAACGDPLSRPFDGLPVDGDFTARVGAPAAIQRDAAPGAWRWGKLHRLIITPLFSHPALNLPVPNKHFDAPSSLDQIVAAGESRWVFQ